MRRGHSILETETPLVEAHLDAPAASQPAVEFRNVTRIYGSGGTRVVALDEVGAIIVAGALLLVRTVRGALGAEPLAG